VSLASRRTNLAFTGVVPGRRETQAVVDEKLAEATQEPEGLDAETARSFLSLRVAQAWSRFRGAISPPRVILEDHARAGLASRCVDRLVALGSRALCEVLSGEELLEALDRATTSGWNEGSPPPDVVRIWCWSATRVSVLGYTLAVAGNVKVAECVRVEALFSALAFSFLKPGFSKVSPSAAKDLVTLVLDLERAIGRDGVRLLSEVLRRPLRRHDVARLERFYAGLAPIAASERSAEPREMPTEPLLVKRATIANALGVDPRTLTAWAKRPGFPPPLWEGNRQCFCAASVAQWAHLNGQVFDLEQLPRDLRDRVERARDLLWLDDREAKRKERETEQSREAFVAKKCREDQEQIAEAAAKRAEGRSSA